MKVLMRHASIALSLVVVIVLTFNHTLAQNVGVDVATPQQKLDVAGGLRISTSGNAIAGSIRFNAGQFEVCAVNGIWTSIGSMGSQGSLDDAYDNGSTITADVGSVAINGTAGIFVSGTYGSGLAVGATGGIPEGAGTRMFFNPSKAAFRAGYVSGTQWNDANIGAYSTAMGKSTTASGFESTAMGQSTTASGTTSTAMGEGTTASGGSSTAMGYGTTASGIASTTMGFLTTASGTTSTAMGSATAATGLYSTAMGEGTIASGNVSTAMGRSTTALGSFSTAMGLLTAAPSFVETVVGQFNTTYIPANATDWNAADRLFVVGNGTGTGASSSNALTIYKDGRMNINDAYDMPMADGAAGQVMSTNGLGVVSFVDPGTLNPVIFANTSGVTSNENGTYATDDFVFGSPQLADNGNTANDNRFFFDKSKGAFRAGRAFSTQWDDANVGNSSVALGSNTTASGNSSTAMGEGTIASGNTSTAMGYQTIASLSASTAMGYQTIASGNTSTAMGWSTTAPSFAETAVGRFNTTYTPASTIVWNAADRLFVVGNGTSSSARNDAMVVLKNGNTGLGTSTPTHKLHVIGTDNSVFRLQGIGSYGSGARFNFGDQNLVYIEEDIDDHIHYYAATRHWFDGGYVGLGTSTPTSQIHIKQTGVSPNDPLGFGITLDQPNGNEWQIWNSGLYCSFAYNNTRVAYVNNTSGAWTVTSDRRVKKDIEPMEDVLSKVMQLNTVKYRYNHNEDDAIKTRGFIAQEVQEVFPDLVYSEDGDRLGIAPSDFGILSIKAIQEQQALIEQLLQRIEQLENR